MTEAAAAAATAAAPLLWLSRWLALSRRRWEKPLGDLPPNCQAANHLHQHHGQAFEQRNVSTDWTSLRPRTSPPPADDPLRALSPLPTALPAARVRPAVRLPRPLQQSCLCLLRDPAR